MEHWNTGCRTLRKPLVKIRFYYRLRIEDGLPGFLQLREEKFNLPHKAGLGGASKREQVKFKIYDELLDSGALHIRLNLKFMMNFKIKTTITAGH